MERRDFSGLRIALMLVLLPSACLGMPSFNPKPSWRESAQLAEENGTPTLLASACNPATGRCWGWLPVVDGQPGLNDYAAEQDPDYDSYRPQTIRVRDVDQMADLWRDAPPPASAYGLGPRDANLQLHPPSGSGSQMPTGRLAKKDMFMSRGWGAGGMPFSVLYMSPRGNHPPSAGSEKSADSARRSGDAAALSASSPSAAPAGRANGRVAVRNGSYNQQRRHYSIIPQLFISYGWGPSGK